MALTRAAAGNSAAQARVSVSMELLVELYNGAVGMPRRTIQEPTLRGGSLDGARAGRHRSQLASMTQNLITGMLVHDQAEATAKTGKQHP
jgi:hypothetical protein